MDPIQLAEQIEARYRRYLETTFYFRDSELRESFRELLKSGHLSKGPYREAAPEFKWGKITGDLFREVLVDPPDKGFIDAMWGNRPLYLHQEESIRKVSAEKRNVVVATGTASGKTEAFLYPILLHLYKEFRTGQLGPGVRALILYPMNALANDQRERLGEICKKLQDEGSPFKFTFGQYIGETPEDENDSKRHAREHIAKKLAGELVLRKEMRDTPPHILLTNYSMLEYLLIRPDDSPLFDDGRAQWWTFIVLDEAHQYRGAKGIEMAMLIRRLKRRLREGGRSGTFQCIATSATIAGGENDKSAVAIFASELFGEKFGGEDVIIGAVVAPSSGTLPLSTRYHFFLRSLEGAFVSYFPQKRLFLDRHTKTKDGAVFEIALCQECGQHYLVGRFRDNVLQEAVRDPGHPDFGATFFRPVETAVSEVDEQENDRKERRVFQLCVKCGAMVEINKKEAKLKCEHTEFIFVEQQEGAEEREDQIPRCSACGYRGKDPVREVIHGTDGPHAVIATTICQNLPPERRKVLAFADGRQEAAFFAWYLENSYKDITTVRLS